MIPLKDFLKEQFGIHVPGTFKAGNRDAFRVQSTLGIIVPVQHMDEQELYELYYMSQYLQEKREPYVASFWPSLQGALSAEKDGRRYAILKCPDKLMSRSQSPGRELAQFHQRARSYPYQADKTKRIGEWKNLWERRLDQLEAFWRGKVQAHPLDHFEKLFIESFPYYLGMAENGIQYLVDTELDDEPLASDSATICHNRFHSQVWNKEFPMKLPTDWVFDHAARDLAEYLRYEFIENPEQLRSEGGSFLEDYDRTAPISSFGWRLIYSRLLFPIHYFECIEDYYLSSESGKPFYEKKLQQLLSRSAEYEQFLTSYSAMLSMRTRKIQLPVLHWLG
ncbi:spore coat protein YutH [Bacillus sp. FJAT-42376]|uniref:spore coat putative kinase YutH n=1 Tax=Bacillus sp. FJAT-42376 TaxID=2014076 RepID=UPI000F4FC648|nr:spore coat protein YutH [Bacillus sp. FJAT-42376]AZB44285.1 spore coat protein YutH [Bacillus sp. FJAT-42376]